MASRILRQAPWRRTISRFPVVPTLASTSAYRRLINTVTKCPEPTCECSDTPPMPEGLPIDYEGKLNGLISNYAQHVLICTDKDDWTSRIEEDNGGDNLAADLRELIGRGGKFSDVS